MHIAKFPKGAPVKVLGFEGIFTVQVSFVKWYGDSRRVVYHVLRDSTHPKGSIAISGVEEHDLVPITPYKEMLKRLL